MSGASGRSNEVHSALRGTPDAKRSFSLIAGEAILKHPRVTVLSLAIAAGTISAGIVFEVVPFLASFAEEHFKRVEKSRIEADERDARGLPLQLNRGSLVTAGNAFCVEALKDQKFTVTLSDGTKAVMDCSPK